MELEDIFERLQAVIVEQLSVAEASVTRSASFLDDLGMDSLEAVELVMAIEEEFDIEMPDEDAEKLVTVGDVAAYIKKCIEEYQ